MIVPLSGCLIRLVSQYLCPFTSNNLISQLIKYSESREKITTTVVMYFVDNRDDITIDTKINKFIKKNIKTILETILDGYNKNRFDILNYLSKKFCANPQIANQHYWTHGIINVIDPTRLYKIDLNLIDYIVLQACIKRNEIFLTDFISSIGYVESHPRFYFKCYLDGTRRPDRRGRPHIQREI